MTDDEMPPDPFEGQEIFINEEDLPDHPDFHIMQGIIENLDMVMQVDMEEAATKVMQQEQEDDSPLTEQLRKVVDVNSLYVMSARRGGLAINRLSQLSLLILQKNGMMIAPQVLQFQIAGTSFIDGFLVGYYFSQQGGHKVQ